jgi:hypothetical protein
VRMRKKSAERKRERRNIYLALTIRKRMNERSMAGLIQRFSTRISTVWYGCYDVRSVMVFGMPGVSLANTTAVIME